MYYSIESSLRLQRCVTEYPDIGVSFLDGRVLDPTSILPPIRVSGLFDKATPPSHFEGGKIPLFSEPLLSALASAGIDNLQLFPAIIVGQAGGTWSHYRAVQIVGVVRCVDLKATDHVVIGPGNDNVPPLIHALNLQLDPNRIPAEVRLFRPAEQPTAIIMADSVLEFLIAQRPTEGWGIQYKQVTP